ncbi:MAG: hypothetical protein AAGA75_09385 [Cyanobacteria bacterium P01_E01_bin.6]
MVDSALYLDSLPVRCRVSGLTVIQSGHDDGEEIEQILMADRPFCIQVTVEWLGNAAIALLMLDPTLSVEFVAKPAGIGDKIELATASETMQAPQLAYTPRLDLNTPHSYGLEAGVYHLNAIIRVGAEAGPAMLCGVYEGIIIEIFNPPQSATSRKQSPKHK